MYIITCRATKVYNIHTNKIHTVTRIPFHTVLYAAQLGKASRQFTLVIAASQDRALSSEADSTRKSAHQANCLVFNVTKRCRLHIIMLWYCSILDIHNMYFSLELQCCIYFKWKWNADRSSIIRTYIIHTYPSDFVLYYVRLYAQSRASLAEAYICCASFYFIYIKKRLNILTDQTYYIIIQVLCCVHCIYCIYIV